MRNNFNKADPYWLIFIMGAMVVLFDLFNIFPSIKIIYEIMAGVEFIILLIAIRLFYSNSFMAEFFSKLNKNKNRDELEEKVGRGRSTFLSPAVFLHILCGLYFIISIQDILLTMAFLFILFYQRVMDLGLRVAIVNYLKAADINDMIDDIFNNEIINK